MKKSSKLLSLVLCITMVLSLFTGLSATAVTDEADGDVYTVGSVTDSNVGTSSDTEDPDMEAPDTEAPDTEAPDAENPDAEDATETKLEIMSLAATSDAAYWAYYASSAVSGIDYTEVGGNYTINTALGLAYLAGVVNSGNELSGKTVTLTASIDLSDYFWVPIGQLKLLDNDTKTIDDVNTHPFRGTFDGEGHYIDGMTIGGDEYSIGAGFSSEGNALFGMNYGTIKNVGVTNINVATYRRGAGIAGMNYGSVEYCMSSGSISANGGGSTRGTGGIVGSNYGRVSYCYSSASVYNAYRRAGGIVGYNSIDGAYYGSIDHCFFTGYAESVNATFSGSIACTNDPGCTVTNCYYLINSAKDAQDNGCAAGYANGAQAYEFNTHGKLTDGSGKHILTEINSGLTTDAFITYQEMSFPVLLWETEYHHTAFIIPTLTIKSANGVFADIKLTLDQVEAFKTAKMNLVKNDASGDTTYSAVEGITLTDLLNNFVPYGKYATEMVFSTGGSNPSYSESFVPSDLNDAMLLWSAIEIGQSKNEISGFMSALNGSAPEYWLEDAAVLTVTQPIVSITFATQPSNALIDVRDETGNRVSPSSGNAKIYNLVQGEKYTYTVAATGYTPHSGAIERTAQSGTISLTLNSSTPGGNPGSETNHSVVSYSGTFGKVTPDKSTAKSGDLITLTVTQEEGYGISFLSVSNTAIMQEVSCNTYTYTFSMPDSDVTISATFSPIIFVVNKQDGKSGTPVKAAVFTKEELNAKADTNANGWAYLFAQDSKWRAIVATKLVKLDTLFSTAGISSNEWKKNSYLAFKCDDGEYDKSYPYYENINACQYYYATGIQDTVPAGIAIDWDSGSLDDFTVKQLADRAYDSGRLRFVYGISQEQYDNKNAAGARSPSGVLEMTVVYNSTPPDGSVGTEHNGTTTINENGTPLGESPYESVTIEATVTESKDSAGNISVKASVASGVIEEALKELSEGFALEVNAVSAAGDAISVEVVLPAEGIKAAAENKTGIVIVSNLGLIHFEYEALEAMISTSYGSGNITISIANVTVMSDSGMNDAQKATAGTNTVIRLEAKDTSGKSVANFGSGKATITIDYVRKNLNAIVDVSRISADGGTTDMNAVFSDNKIKWSTSTFSFYMITEELIMNFTDVSVGDWFYEAVEFVFKRGLFSGVTETTFAPNTTMTRAMLVTVLYRLEGQPSVTGGTGVFSDVTDTGAYYFSAVLWASQNGIVNGYPGGSFGVNDPITREQMVAILYRYTQYKGYDDTAAGTLAAYADAGSISGWALDAMTWAATYGIITGMSSTEISPDGNTTRAQVATILQRYIENIFE